MKLQGSVEKIVVALCLHELHQAQFPGKGLYRRFSRYELQNSHSTDYTSLHLIRIFLPFCTPPNSDQTPACNSMYAPPATTIGPKVPEF